MDSDITFGDVEEERPKTERRPEENRHFSVLECGERKEGELRVYVDLDAMIDMENHAQTDTSVELGGVMLGGQYTDEQGQPFVVVSDCLRADHFEATKGSFKFTHDTWSDIQRRLEEFPDDLRMVGWYHTHPDWGVFLSGMDLFICENFFNKPLDLALVIDPCRDDRGWFQWTNTSRRGPLRMGGFYLVASRFREAELAEAAQALLGGSGMPLATRQTSSTSGGYGAPVVNVMQDRSSQWTQVAVLGSLALQTILVAVIAWAMIGSRGRDETASGEKLAIEAKKAALAEIAGHLTEGGERYVKEHDAAIEKRKNAEAGLYAIRLERDELAADVDFWKKKHADSEIELKKVTADRETVNAELERKNKLLYAKGQKESQSGDTLAFNWKSPWVWVVVVVAVGLAVFGVVMLRSSREPEPPLEDYPPRPREEPKETPEDTNTN